MTTSETVAPHFQCFVLGTPAPQGSKRAVGPGRMIESSNKVGPWRSDVTLQVRGAMIQHEFVGFRPYEPVHLTLAFSLRRPLTLPRKVGHHTRKPDLDKLIRSTLDALVTAQLIHDDAQVCTVLATKVYVAGQDGIGCVIVAAAMVP